MILNNVKKKIPLNKTCFLKVTKKRKRTSIYKEIKKLYLLKNYVNNCKIFMIIKMKIKKIYLFFVTVNILKLKDLYICVLIKSNLGSLRLQISFQNKKIKHFSYFSSLKSKVVISFSLLLNYNN